MQVLQSLMRATLASIWLFAASELELVEGIRSGAFSINNRYLFSQSKNPGTLSLKDLLYLRGGAHDDSDPHESGQPSPQTPSTGYRGEDSSDAYAPQQQQQQDEYDAYLANSQMTGATIPDQSSDNPYVETEQQRVERWKQQQREQAWVEQQMQQQQQSMATSSNNGRRQVQQQQQSQQPTNPLLATVGKGTRCVFFFVLMWRNIGLFEMADQSFRHGGRRALVVTPLVFLFVANLFGALTSMSSTPSPGAKRRLKAILNIDKMLEGMLLMVNFLRASLFPSKLVPQEIYVANMLHSLIFMIQCHAFTRVSWNDNANKPVPSSFASRLEGDDDDDDGYGGSYITDPSDYYYGGQQQQQQQQPYSQDPKYNNFGDSRY